VAAPFSLTLEVTVGATLDLALISHNPGDQPLLLTQALHTYFNVGDAPGAGPRARRPCLHRQGRRRPSGRAASSREPVTLRRPKSTASTWTPTALWIDDPASAGRSTSSATGSRSAVVWNPWIDKAAAMGDFGDDEYRRMVCVETTNAADDASSSRRRDLSPGHPLPHRAPMKRNRPTMTDTASRRPLAAMAGLGAGARRHPPTDARCSPPAPRSGTAATMSR
jgi:D-hexose-6-phosphate mutarotase